MKKIAKWISARILRALKKIDEAHSPIEEDLSRKKCAVDETYAKWKFGSKYDMKPIFRIFYRELFEKWFFKVSQKFHTKIDINQPCIKANYQDGAFLLQLIL